MPPALVTRDDIVEVGLDCKPLDPNAPRLNGERFIHCQVYRARPDVASVIHTHDLAVIPFGLAKVRLRPVVAQAGFLPRETPLFEVRDHATECGSSTPSLMPSRDGSGSAAPARTHAALD